MRYIPQVPVLLVGPPGIGKTASVAATFDHAEVVLASSMVEEDIAGLPYRQGKHDMRTTSGMFRRLQEMAHAGKTTCLFLDELDKSRRSVADTLLTLIVSRKVGDAALPDSTCIIAAANPPEWGGGDGISEAMISRFSVVDYIPDVKAWTAWATKRYHHPACLRVIYAVGVGELPLVDRAGDDFARRITCPRTLAMTLALIEASPENIPEALVRGLLTSASASQVMHLATATTNDVMDIATSVAHQASAGRVRTPVRIGS